MPEAETSEAQLTQLSLQLSRLVDLHLPSVLPSETSRNVLRRRVEETKVPPGFGIHLQARDPGKCPEIINHITRDRKRPPTDQPLLHQEGPIKQQRQNRPDLSAQLPVQYIPLFESYVVCTPKQTPDLRPMGS